MSEKPIDFSEPWVGDRYVLRHECAEITAVTASHVTLEVTNEDGCFSKTITREEFKIQEDRTFQRGADFQPAMRREGGKQP